MEKHETLSPNPRRAVLRMAVASILNEKGFVRADKECIESLTEVFIEIANRKRCQSFH